MEEKIEVAGISKIRTFHYSKNGHCVATLANEITGVVGNTAACPLNVMLSLRNADAPIKWQKAAGTWTDKLGVVHPNYQLEWSLE